MQHVVAIAKPCDLQPGQRLAMFDHGQQIGDDLAGMRFVGQAVDHRNGRMARHFLDLGMIVGAQHDGIDHPAQHAGGIGDALAAPQLAGGRIEDQHAAAQLPHRDVKADTGAGRILLEHQRQHMARQRRIGIGCAFGVPRARGFAVDRIGNHRGDIIRPGIRQIEKVAGLFACPHHAGSGTVKLAAPADNLSKNSSISASPTTSGGMMRMVLSPAATVSSW